MRSAPAVFAVFFLGSNDDDDLRAKIKMDLHDAHRASSTHANPARTSPHFAGEATHRDDAYTVHGAFLSGDREARRIATWWRRYHDDA